MKQKLILLAVLAMFVVCCIAKETLVPTAGTVERIADAPTLVLDAGHGGEDGGAISITGVSESQINLAIACKLEDILSFYGVPVQMLRREDISLHDPGCTTLREKKVSDLHNRAAMVEAAHPALFVSIHQNSYPQERYRGAQVFYGDAQGSKEAAEQIQSALATALAPKNTRAAKPVANTVYLMNHITCPAVLVECGFLTNYEEEALLRQESYQRKLAAALAGAILTINFTTE